jgi:epoxyqueuosine reductase QueG
MLYFNEYHRINELLNKIVTKGTQYLIKNGFKAIAQTATLVIKDDNYDTDLPHKTIATRAGLGWIGKCALFITKEYGSGIRISSILTNAELDFNDPIEESFCGDCMECVKHCPGEAITGELWNVKTKRSEIFDAKKCAKTAQTISMEKIKKEITLCGKCIEVCPYTIKYVNKYNENNNGK